MAEQEERRIVFDLEPYADGTPRQVVVTLPPGRELDFAARQEIIDTLTRVARRTGKA